MEAWEWCSLWKISMVLVYCLPLQNKICLFKRECLIYLALKESLKLRICEIWISSSIFTQLKKLIKSQLWHPKNLQFMFNFNPINLEILSLIWISKPSKLEYNSEICLFYQSWLSWKIVFNLLSRLSNLPLLKRFKLPHQILGKQLLTYKCKISWVV